MRLKQRINEATETSIYLDYLNEHIHKDCKKYMSLIHGKPPMGRGLEPYHPIGIKDVRKDRRALGMEQKEADALNKELEKNGHIRRDVSLFCTSKPENSGTFGRPYLVFPLDPIKGYTWLEAEDINMSGPGWSSFAIEAWYQTEIMGGNQLKHSKILEFLKKPFLEHFHTNTGFDTAYQHGYELWFECNKYYYVSMRMYEWDMAKQMVVSKHWSGK
jgi:hypothetical protein